ncbi:MAG TPA: DUF951 domain-containing protein [Chloroflexia bacterium]|nr:DUF951 domain-containing protein [Chloroflexia bacterium]
MQPRDIRIGDVYRLRKPHPCGSYDWRVVRVGGDIGMRCAKCDHKVLLPRSEFERRIKTLVARSEIEPETKNETD